MEENKQSGEPIAEASDVRARLHGTMLQARAIDQPEPLRVHPDQLQPRAETEN